MIDWCLEELKFKAKIFERIGAVSVYTGDVVKSDTLIPDSLKQALKAAVVQLERVPAAEQDWHPGSDQKVLDLVHPSLFPLVYGRTRILTDGTVGLDDCIERCGQGTTVPVPPAEEADLVDSGARYPWEQPFGANAFSTQFQWLPCDVDLSGGKGSAKITSYINNLHPRGKKDLYPIIEEILARTIPMWDLTLTPLKTPLRTIQQSQRIQYDNVDYDPDPENGPDTDGPQQEEDEDEDDYYDRRQEWIAATRRVVKPEPGKFNPSPILEVQHKYAMGETEGLDPKTSVDIYRDFGDRGLQVIVKLANIHLTPEKPEYEGGSWHVEGQLNEHICASAIYYYDSENITTSRLAFRQQSDTEIDLDYPQHVHDWFTVVYGCENEDPAAQNVGTVDTPEGRLLTWPNILQHQVQPFKLEDPAKPGHRKILAFFLVDPNIRIISTANVPCQQKDWWSDAVRRGGGAIPSLPVELQDHVFRDVDDFPISLQEAKELRLKLMEERKVYVLKNDAAFNQHAFSLCEH